MLLYANGMTGVVRSGLGFQIFRDKEEKLNKKSVVEVGELYFLLCLNVILFLIPSIKESPVSRKNASRRAKNIFCSHQYKNKKPLK